MSNNQNWESIVDNLEGLGLGAALFLGGLVVTVFDIALGAMMGIPMILVGILFPVLMTHRARSEELRQESRRRPEHDRTAGYTISSSSLRRRR